METVHFDTCYKNVIKNLNTTKKFIFSRKAKPYNLKCLVPGTFVSTPADFSDLIQSISFFTYAIPNFEEFSNPCIFTRQCFFLVVLIQYITIINEIKYHVYVDYDTRYYKDTDGLCKHLETRDRFTKDYLIPFIFNRQIYHSNSASIFIRNKEKEQYIFPLHIDSPCNSFKYNNNNNNNNLKILLWNILAPSLNRTNSGDWVKRKQVIKDYLSDFNADICTLTEVDEYFYEDQKIWSYFDFLDQFIISTLNYSYIYMPKTQSVQNIQSRHGNVIMWKRHIFSYNYHITIPFDNDPDSENQLALFLSLKHKNSKENFLVVSTHLKSMSSKKFFSDNANKFDQSKFENIILNPVKNTINLNKRFENISSILDTCNDLINKSEIDNLILMGDFNEHYTQEILKYIVSKKYTKSKILNNIQTIYSLCCDNNSNSIPCKSTQAPINNKSSNAKDSVHSDERLDYIIFGGKIRQNKIRVENFDDEFIKNFLDKNTSDHYPVIGIVTNINQSIN
jgi:endonuclease/exonuclease/phosphatase family metal-dependent hydrolase